MRPDAGSARQRRSQVDQSTTLLIDAVAVHSLADQLGHGQIAMARFVTQSCLVVWIQIDEGADH